MIFKQILPDRNNEGKRTDINVYTEKITPTSRWLRKMKTKKEK